MQMAIGFAVVSEALSAEAMGAATAPSDMTVAVVARTFAGPTSLINSAKSRCDLGVRGRPDGWCCR